VIISEPIYSINLFERIRKDERAKILLGIKKDFWEPEKFIEKSETPQETLLSRFPKNYIRTQISPMKSDQNVIFALEKKKTSWLD
jgi:hypothetical protein